ALLEGGFEVDPYQRGLVNYNQRNWEPALASLLDYVAVSGLDYPPDSHLFIAQAYRALGNFQAAESELNALITRFQPDDGTSWALAHLELADLQAALGNVEGAFATLDAFVEDYPELPQAADALHQAGVLARSQGDIQRAGGYFTRLANNYASDPRGAEGLFSLGIDSYVAADFPTAEGYFTRAAQASGNPEPEAGTFWLGKTLLQSGRAEDAAGVFDNLTVLNPNGYHALRAQDIQANQVPFADPVGLTVPADRDAGRAETEQWLVETFALTEQPPLALTLRSDIAADPRLARAQELWTLGMEEDAKQDFEAIRVAYRDDPLASYQLAVTFRDIGLYRSSIMSAGAVYRLAGIHPLEGPDFLARLFYPVYFDDLVVAYSQQYDLDPLFVFSLIYQESLFEGFATSSASAQGLMQIWPPTGEDIAVALNWPDYRTSELRRPVVSVAFGTWLLNEEAERFDGDRFAMLAAYNGGPGNTATWLDGTNGDPDLFVESITFSETARYIKRIYEHYHIYQTLYGEP
ncbi:MAG: transglycosylase SLT domain-containing protein, partial [Chloroflexi bacterium]|nr:transglycosylase SLT domain-containing protein [Chloroflexota bacterium]